jgi:hypothetical protein
VSVGAQAAAKRATEIIKAKGLAATTRDLLLEMIILGSHEAAKPGLWVMGQVGDWRHKRFSLLPGVEEEGERKEEKDSHPQTSP